MPKCTKGLTTEEIQKVLADLEKEFFDDFDSDCELENEEDDLNQKSSQTFLSHRPLAMIFGFGKTPAYLILNVCKSINLNVFSVAGTTTYFKRIKFLTVEKHSV
ncbi:hypothetical protein TNCV_4143881 [Trichonephila clavipes]|nr:hypothetical protein TNCV_4143881 [Trichonephila clavipes]